MIVVVALPRDRVVALADRLELAEIGFAFELAGALARQIGCQRTGKGHAVKKTMRFMNRGSLHRAAL